MMPSPNYLLRDLVHMFISRAELLPEDETIQEHQQAKEDEARLLAADRTGPGLFKGAFRRQQHPSRHLHYRRGVMDREDNVVRCPNCHWELEHGECLQCGFHEYESGDSITDSELELSTPHSELSEFEPDDDDMDDAFYGIAYPHSSRHPEGYESSDASSTSHSPYYEDANEVMDDFSERRIYDQRDSGSDDSGSDDAGSEDSGSESTMTSFRQEAQSGAEDQAFDDDDGRLSRNSGARHYNDDENYHSDTQITNYDESTEASEDEDYQPTRRQHRRGRPIVISDDEDEDQQGNIGRSTTEGSEGGDDEGDDGGMAEEDFEDGGSVSEGSDVRPPQRRVRPPQASALRRRHLATQRARRHTPGLHLSRHSRRAQGNIFQPPRERLQNLTRQGSTNLYRRTPIASPNGWLNNFHRPEWRQIPMTGRMGAS